jgi:phosphoglycerate dehydrogenase-like enzyme
VRTTPGRNAQATADLTLALILDAVRRTSASQQWLRSGSWTARDQYLPYELFRGPQLSDLTLGIVGLGRVGVEVAHRALGFGMRVLAHGPHLTPAGAPDGVEATGLPDLLRRSDVISLHAPARPDTRGLIGAVEIARMRRGAVLVNTARASLIDEDAVVDALRTGHLGAAAFDVFWREPLPPGHPLLRLPQVVLTPHIGGASDSVVRNHSRAAVDHLLSWLGGRTA